MRVMLCLVGYDVRCFFVEFFLVLAIACRLQAEDTRALLARGYRHQDSFAHTLLVGFFACTLVLVSDVSLISAAGAGDLDGAGGGGAPARHLPAGGDIPPPTLVQAVVALSTILMPRT